MALIWDQYTAKQKAILESTMPKAELEAMKTRQVFTQQPNPTPTAGFANNASLNYASNNLQGKSLQDLNARIQELQSRNSSLTPQERTELEANKRSAQEWHTLSQNNARKAYTNKDEKALKLFNEQQTIQQQMVALQNGDVPTGTVGYGQSADYYNLLNQANQFDQQQSQIAAQMQQRGVTPPSAPSNNFRQQLDARFKDTDVSKLMSQEQVNTIKQQLDPLQSQYDQYGQDIINYGSTLSPNNAQYGSQQYIDNLYGNQQIPTHSAQQSPSFGALNFSTILQKYLQGGGANPRTIAPMFGGQPVGGAAPNGQQVAPNTPIANNANRLNFVSRTPTNNVPQGGY